jgi:hypothetical protein
MKKRQEPMSKNPERFGGTYLDAENNGMYFYADAPPLGRIRIGLGSRAFSMDWRVVGEDEDVDVAEDEDEGEDEDSCIVAFEHLFDPSEAEKSIQALDDLTRDWPELWSRLYQALVQIREEYDCETDVTANNCEFAICPMEYTTEDGQRLWAFCAELEEWDGYWTIEFDPQGNILDRVVTY